MHLRPLQLQSMMCLALLLLPCRPCTPGLIAPHAHAVTLKLHSMLCWVPSLLPCWSGAYQLHRSQQACQRGNSSTHHRAPQPLLCVLQELLPRIVALWHALHVPLVHRSRFYLAFQGREAFYFESEHRRLVYLAGQSGVDPGKPWQKPLQAEA